MSVCKVEPSAQAHWVVLDYQVESLGSTKALTLSPRLKPIGLIPQRVGRSTEPLEGSVKRPKWSTLAVRAIPRRVVLDYQVESLGSTKALTLSPRLKPTGLIP
ncbi:hypothetical protein SDJN03_27003, partial [Cucurbita argyrosperma subsp. sororia]